MNRRAFIALVPSIALSGCLTRLGLADRVEIARKSVRLQPSETADPIDAAVRRYDSDERAYYDGEIHDALADEIGADEPLVLSDALVTDLQREFESVEYRIRACETGAEDDCRRTTLVREDFNELEVGDVADLVFRSSGGLVSVHERREERD
ncbi:hypothetical protein [Natronorubrum sp. FCH18a]|uniref:hypothetical protein n=1 Tax=Natronorubrum sp. FCH18a TaxID=3447018 RepID=UPI003F5107A0